jgi:hypothetical protein
MSFAHEYMNTQTMLIKRCLELVDIRRLEGREHVLEDTRVDCRGRRRPGHARGRDGALEVVDVTIRIRKRRGRLDEAEVVLNDTETARRRVQEDNDVVKGNVILIETTVEVSLSGLRTDNFRIDVNAEGTLNLLRTTFLRVNLALESSLLQHRTVCLTLDLRVESRLGIFRSILLVVDAFLQESVRRNTRSDFRIKVALEERVSILACRSFRRQGICCRLRVGLRDANLVHNTIGRLNRIHRDGRAVILDLCGLVLDDVEATRAVDDERIIELNLDCDRRTLRDLAHRFTVRQGRNLVVRANRRVREAFKGRRQVAGCERADVVKDRRDGRHNLALDRLFEDSLVRLVLLGDKGTLGTDAREVKDFLLSRVRRRLGSDKFALDIEEVLGTRRGAVMLDRILSSARGHVCLCRGWCRSWCRGRCRSRSWCRGRCGRRSGCRSRRRSGCGSR